MKQPFDLFRKGVDGRMLWCGEARSLAEAHAKIRRLDDTTIEFLIVNEDTGERLIINPQQPPLSKSA